MRRQTIWGQPIPLHLTIILAYGDTGFSPAKDGWIRPPDDPEKTGTTVWAIFPKATNYSAPSHASFMMIFSVEDLDGLLAALQEEEVEVDPRREDYNYGRFDWIMDPEGNRIELWEPPKSQAKEEKQPDKQFLYWLHPTRADLLKTGPTKEEAALVEEHF